MKQSGPSNSWELQTREILRSIFPEYDVDPHMRLSNVVKGRIETNRQMAMYEIDFCVREKTTGFVVCAVELDGWQHQTENGKRKDTNKNRWLEDAGITLIRIKKPEEAVYVRERMEEKKHEKLPRFVRKKNAEFGVIGKTMAATVIVLIGTWLVLRSMEGWGNRTRVGLTQPVIEKQEKSEINKSIIAQQQQAPIEAAAKQRLEQSPEKAEVQRVIAHKASFEESYHKPAGCDNPQNMQVMIECSNHYIREKKKFNAANDYQ